MTTNNSVGKEDEFINKHLNVIMDKTLDGMIVTHIEKMWGGLEMASVQHFVETGKVNGSFYLRIKELAKQFAANWHNTAAQPLSPQSSEGVEEINCKICSRIIEEEAHHCEISDCPHRNNDGELTAKKICRKHLNNSQWYAPLLEPKIIAAMTECSSLMNKEKDEKIEELKDKLAKEEFSHGLTINDYNVTNRAYNQLQQLLSEKEKDLASYKESFENNKEQFMELAAHAKDLELSNESKEKEIEELKKQQSDDLESMVKINKEKNYWKQRCEAAEDVFYRESFPGEPAWEKWQQLKQSPIN